MSSQTLKFKFAAPTRSTKSSFLWIVGVIGLGVWSGFDLFWIAFLCGTVLDYFLRFTKWRGQLTPTLAVFFGPIVLVSILGVLFDERIWLKPLWAISGLFFVGMIVGSLGGVAFNAESLVLRSFAFWKLWVPYGSIEFAELSRLTERGTARVRLAFKDPKSGELKEQFLQFRDQDARQFVAEVTKRQGFDQTAST